jgi:hypothetical protein
MSHTEVRCATSCCRSVWSAILPCIWGIALRGSLLGMLIGCQPKSEIPEPAKPATINDLVGRWSYSNPNAVRPGELTDLDLKFAADGSCSARWSLHFGETYSKELTVSTTGDKLTISVPKISGKGQTVPMFGQYSLAPNASQGSLLVSRVDPDEKEAIDYLVLNRRSE